MKRLFIGLKVEAGETLLKTISSLKTGLSYESVKWTRLENLHVTLEFLGDTDEKLIRVISDILRLSCEGFERFDITLKGTGVFRNFNDPRILWVGIESSRQLNQLNEVIKNGLKGAGIKTEDKPFNPHLTLARIKKISDNQIFKSEVEEFQNTVFQIVTVPEVVLYESTLQQPGPVYTPLYKFQLITDQSSS